MRAPPPSTASRSAVEVVAIDAREARGFRHVVLCALEQVEHQGNWPRWIGFCSGSNLPPIREDRSTLPIENQSFVNSGEGVLSLHFLFQDLTRTYLKIADCCRSGINDE